MTQATNPTAAEGRTREEIEAHISQLEDLKAHRRANGLATIVEDVSLAHCRAELAALDAREKRAKALSELAASDAELLDPPAPAIAEPAPPARAYDGYKRPIGSNADEWHLFLAEWLSVNGRRIEGLPFMCVQIAEAIDDAERRGRRPETGEDNANIVLGSNRTNDEIRRRDVGHRAPESGTKNAVAHEPLGDAHDRVAIHHGGHAAIAGAPGTAEVRAIAKVIANCNDSVSDEWLKGGAWEAAERLIARFPSLTVPASAASWQYTSAVGEAAQDYIKQCWGEHFAGNEHRLPSTFFWHECFDRMVRALTLPAASQDSRADDGVEPNA